MSAWGVQFSVGDQTHESRYAFWRSDFKICPKCSRSQITSQNTVAGCLMNGDAYGTTVFKCDGCSWFTSFQYDDASENYYYEMSDWERLNAKNKAVQQ